MLFHETERVESISYMISVANWYRQAIWGSYFDFLLIIGDFAKRRRVWSKYGLGLTRLLGFDSVCETVKSLSSCHCWISWLNLLSVVLVCQNRQPPPFLRLSFHCNNKSGRSLFPFLSANLSGGGVLGAWSALRYRKWNWFMLNTGFSLHLLFFSFWGLLNRLPIVSVSVVAALQVLVGYRNYREA